jgi:hypothetical protein
VQVQVKNAQVPPCRAAVHPHVLFLPPLFHCPLQILIWILVCAVIVSAGLQSWTDMALIGGVVIINVALGEGAQGGGWGGGGGREGGERGAPCNKHLVISKCDGGGAKADSTACPPSMHPYTPGVVGTPFMDTVRVRAQITMTPHVHQLPSTPPHPPPQACSRRARRRMLRRPSRPC